ncbi:MAG: helix-turn-helix transcriptional regulator [Lachnospiraceae bacterium]|nr:helix-turn-helix transcriptional regulator [Lachnospiraceae bacterium]
MMTTWKEVREELPLSAEDEKVIAMEKALIKTLVSIRKKQGLSQTELADKCGVKQPALARMEGQTHSPQVSSLLRILMPMGYTLQIVPLKESMKQNN